MEFDFKSKLYGSKRHLTKWPSYAIGMKGPAGIVSSLNKTRDQTAKVSTVAFPIEKLMDKKLSVCPVKDECLTYVEYTKSSGDLIRYVVAADVHRKRFQVISDTDYDYGVVSAIFGSVLYNQKVISELGFVQRRDVSDMSVHLQKMPNVSEDEMIQVCDAFYYLIGIDFSCSYEADSNQLDSYIKRFVQNNSLTHDNASADPQGIRLGDVQETVETQSAIFTEPLDTFMERCKNGEFIIPYDWDESQKAAIKPISFLDHYVPTEEFREMLLSVWLQLKEISKKINEGCDYDEIMAEPVNIMIMCKPGSGKTVMAEAILCSLQFPKGIINCKGRSEEDEFEGLNKFIDGQIHAIPTKMSELFNVGGGIILEEVNLPDPDILQGAIGQALVYPYVMKYDGYREYKRHPFTVMLATLNVGTNGSKPLNEAFASRFSEGCILEDVADEEFKNILYSTGYPKMHCDTAFSAYKAAIQYLTENGNDEYILSVTMRGCKKAAQKLSLGFSKQQAFRAAFIAQIYNRDPDVAKDMENLLLRTI